MPESAAIGAEFSSYQGNPELGAVAMPAIQVDTRPLQLLSEYTNRYNQKVWEQKQSDADSQIKELSKIAAINPNSLYGKDKDEMVKQFAQVTKDASDMAREELPSTPQGRIERQLEWDKKTSGVLKNWETTKQRTLDYYRQLNEIDGAAIPEPLKAERRKELNDIFDSSDISTPLKNVLKFDVKPIEIPKPPTTKIQTLGLDGNVNTKTDATVLDWKTAANLANASAHDLSLIVPKDSQAYKNMTPEERAQNDQQAAEGGDALQSADISVPFNAVLNTKEKGSDGQPTNKLLYYDDNGNFLASKFESDNASNAVIMNAYNSIKETNAAASKFISDAQNGIYNNKNLSYKLPSNLDLSGARAAIVDFNKKGVTKAQLILAGIHAKYTGDQVSTILTHTGDASKLQIERENNATRVLINKNTQANENYRKKLEINSKKPAVDADGNPLDFGNIIYGVNSPKPPSGIARSFTNYDAEGKKVEIGSINQGVLLDKKGNPLNYTGTLKVPQTWVDASIPLELSKYSKGSQLFNDGQGQNVLQVENGQIQGIQKTDESGGDGGFLSVDDFKHITIQAAEKGAKKGIPADTNYGKPEKQKKVVVKGL